jgi:hypothetical protein
MEHASSCPYCAEPLDLWVDESGGASQRYIEDCAVCCQPIEVVVEIEDGELVVSVSRSDD